jgi:hypothetical protein
MTLRTDAVTVITLGRCGGLFSAVQATGQLTAIKQSSNQAIKQSSNQAIKQVFLSQRNKGER